MNMRYNPYPQKRQPKRTILLKTHETLMMLKDREIKQLRNPMNPIQAFTQAYSVNDGQAAQILGVSPGHLSEWRSGKRSIPTYIARSIELHLDLSKAHQERIKEKRL